MEISTFDEITVGRGCETQRLDKQLAVKLEEQNHIDRRARAVYILPPQM